MVKLSVGMMLVVLLAGAAIGAEITFKPSPERRFTGATKSYPRRAEYLQSRLTRAAESLDRASCAPNRQSLLTSARGKDLRRAKLIATNMARAERLVAR